MLAFREGKGADTFDAGGILRRQDAETLKGFWHVSAVSFVNTGLYIAG